MMSEKRFRRSTLDEGAVSALGVPLLATVPEMLTTEGRHRIAQQRQSYRWSAAMLAVLGILLVLGLWILSRGV